MTRLVRKMLTFPLVGARLLERAAGRGSKERGQGDYLTAVLQQRYNAWREALGYLLSVGCTRAELRDMLEKWHGLELSLDYRTGGLVDGITLPPAPKSRLVAALCDLLLEYNAANQELLKELADQET